VNQEELTSSIYILMHIVSDYYHLMPKRGFEYTRLEPLDSMQKLNKEFDRVEKTLEFETAERILLGAQFRKNEINPLDYIYRAIGCKIVPLNERDLDVSFILQYMYNSPSAANLRVGSIFRVEVPADADQFKAKVEALSQTKHKDRRLLWHGSKAANLISILSKGLIVNARDAPMTGRSLGDGLYMADVFDKSWNYTFDWRYSR